MDLRKVKDEAAKAFSKGKFVKAAELYSEYCQGDPKDLQARLRQGDAWAKAGKKKEAIDSYRAAAEGFARDGFLPRAIAASKLILELDPAHTGIQQMLANLYASKGGAAGPGTGKPAAKPAFAGATAAGPMRPAAPVTKAPAPAAEPATPSWQNRTDAIDLPEDDWGGKVPIEGNGEEPVALGKPKAPSAPAQAARPAPGAELELDTGIALEVDDGTRPPSAGEVELKLDGSPLDLSAELPPELQLEVVSKKPEAPRPAPEPPAPAPAPLEAEAPPEPSFDVELELESTSPSGPTEAAEPEGIDLELPPSPAPASGAVAAEVLELEAPPAPEEAPVELKKAPVPAPAMVPPGLRPKRLIQADLPPPEVASTVPEAAPVEPPPAAPARAASPQPAAPTSRIWIPGSEPSAPSLPPPAQTRGGRDVDTGLAAFSRFDELEMDFDQSQPSFAEPPPPAAPHTSRIDLPRALVEAAQARAPQAQPEPVAARAETDFSEVEPSAAPPAPPAAAAPRPVATVGSFTELELEGDSLLHAVEVAAQNAIVQRAQAGEGDGGEADFDLSEELGSAAAEAPDPSGLPKIPLFSDLPPDAFIALFEKCPLRRPAQGERIFEQGSQGDAFYVICEGAVKVVREDNGVRRELATLADGAFFGEMALLSGAPRSASVEAASEDTQLLEISAPVLAELSAMYPQVARALKKFCRQRLLTNVMSSSPLFAPFPKKDRRALIEKFRSRDVKKNDVIIREGERSDGLYIVLAGEVRVTKAGMELARLKEGELFGEMSLLQRAAASATVSATKYTTLLRLPREDFDQLILTHPQILALVSELTANRAKATKALMAKKAVGGDELMV